MTRRDLLEQWPLVEADFQEVYGVDLNTPGLLQGRSWRWLKVRLYGLLSAECRTARHFAPPEPKQPSTRRR